MSAAFKELLNASMALGAMPQGLCFCSRDRIGNDTKVHEPECRDMRKAIENGLAEFKPATRPRDGVVYSKLCALTLNGEEIGRLDCTGADAGLCIIARNLAASGHGRPHVDGIKDANGRPPFGFSYAPTDQEIENWKARGHHHETSIADARAEIAKWNGMAD